MPIKEVKRTWSNCRLDYVKEFIVHNEREIQELPKCCIGSMATVCETGNVYTLGKGGNWKLLDEAISEGPGETGGAQSNLDVNDPNDPAYVKNRTHWRGEPEFTEFMPETELEFTAGDGEYFAEYSLGDSGFNRKVDRQDEVHLYLDGVKYVLTVHESNGNEFTALDNDAEFYVGFEYESSSGVVAIKMGGDSHVVKIVICRREAHQIDKMFLPGFLPALDLEEILGTFIYIHATSSPTNLYDYKVDIDLGINAETFERICSMLANTGFVYVRKTLFTVDGSWISDEKSRTLFATIPFFATSADLKTQTVGADLVRATIREDPNNAGKYVFSYYTQYIQHYNMNV